MSAVTFSPSSLSEIINQKLYSRILDGIRKDADITPENKKAYLCEVKKLAENVSCGDENYCQWITKNFGKTKDFKVHLFYKADKKDPAKAQKRPVFAVKVKYNNGSIFNKKSSAPPEKKVSLPQVCEDAKDCVIPRVWTDDMDDCVPPKPYKLDFVPLSLDGKPFGAPAVDDGAGAGGGDGDDDGGDEDAAKITEKMQQLNFEIDEITSEITIIDTEKNLEEKTLKLSEINKLKDEKQNNFNKLQKELKILLQKQDATEDKILVFTQQIKDIEPYLSKSIDEKNASISVEIITSLQAKAGEVYKLIEKKTREKDSADSSNTEKINAEISDLQTQFKNINDKINTLIEIKDIDEDKTKELYDTAVNELQKLKPKALKKPKAPEGAPKSPKVPNDHEIFVKKVKNTNTKLTFCVRDEAVGQVAFAVQTLGLTDYFTDGCIINCYQNEKNLNFCRNMGFKKLELGLYFNQMKYMEQNQQNPRLKRVCASLSKINLRFLPQFEYLDIGKNCRDAVRNLVMIPLIEKFYAENPHLVTSEVRRELCSQSCCYELARRTTGFFYTYSRTGELISNEVDAEKILIGKQMVRFNGSYIGDVLTPGGA